MNRWIANIDFGTYKGEASIWAKDKEEATKRFQKRFPCGTILSIKQAEQL